MSDDAELQAARVIAAAARPLRDQMRADWGHHREPEEVLDDAVEHLTAENERLRAVVYIIWREWAAANVAHDDVPPLRLDQAQDALLDECLTYAADIGLRDQLDATPTGEGT